MASAAVTPVTTGMDAVYYMVKDFARGRKFYETVLGLTPAVEMTGDGGGLFVEYELPDGVAFGLGYMADSPWHEHGGAMFAVPDVKAAQASALAAGGTELFPYFDLPSCEMAGVRDTEGNTFILHRRK